MPRYVAHARAIAKALHGAEGVEVVPDPPHTNMMRIHLRVGEERFRRNALRIAQARGVYTWARSAPGPTPSHRTVELSVGDATLALEPQQAADIIAELAR